MAKHKLARFAAMATYPHVFQPTLDELLSQPYRLSGRWNTEVFHNDHPLVLELGCGKGEYTVGLAERYADRNFIGIDIKGARMWVGATDALNRQIPNAAFLRTRIEMLDRCFAPGEVSEIWITFPDPQPQKKRIGKRLTSARFLNRYLRCLKPDGIVHLKTDSTLLYTYTSRLVSYNQLEVLADTDDLYHSGITDEVLLSIKTQYETLFSSRGATHKYLKFKLNKEVVELTDELTVFATDADRSTPSAHRP